MTTARTERGLRLKWIGLLTLFAVSLLIVTDLTIVQVYHEGLKGSFIAIEGIVLIAGILFSFFLTRNFNLPHERSSKEKEQELVQRTRELEVFYEIGVLINEHLGNLDAVLPISLEKVTSLTGYEIGAIFLLGGAGDVLEMKSQIGHSPAMLQEVKVLRFSEGVSGRAIRLKQPVIVSISEYPSPRIAPVLREEGIQTVVGIPLLAKGKAIGAIILSSRSPHQLGHREVNSLESIGSQIGLALENSVLLNEIRESEEKYRTVVERAIDGVCVIGRDYLFRYVNERLAEIQGYRREELIGTDFRNLLDEESRTLLADREDKRARGIKLPSHFELNVLQKDGWIRNAEISASAVKDSKGDVNIIVLLKDITDRRKAEEALRQSEERYRSIIDNIQEAYYEMDLAGNFTFVNDTICRHLGYSREELIGMNYRQYQDETTAEKMYQLYKKVYETGKPIEILDAELVRKDGTKGIYEMSVSLIRDSEGKPVGFRGVSREVTERKQMERALRQSEEKYRTILESIEDGYYEVDPAGNFTFFNDSMCRIFGYPKEELMGMNDRQYTDKENAKRLFQAFNEVYRTGEPHNGYGYEIIRKDGAKRYIEASILLQKDSSDKPIGFRGIIRDITDRRRAEEALRESEQRYRNLVENAPDVIFTLAPDGTITSLNPAFETITGWSGAEWLHKQFAPMLHPSDLSQGLELFQLFLKGEKIAPFQFKVLTKSGDYLVADFTVAPQIQNQSVIGILGIARDITERKKAEEALKKSEERFEELYDDAPIGYFEYNTDGRITSVNRTESEMLGYSVEEMIGQPPWKFIVEEDIARQQILDMLAGIMPPAQGLERTYRRKDGTTFPALVQDRLFQEAEGKILGIRATILDVTERKRAGESLRQSEEKYRTILESIEDGYYEVDLGGNFTFFNDSMCRILGYPKEELMGMNNQQYADKEVAKKVFQAFNRVYKTGKPGREFDWEIVRKDGTKRYIETSVSLRKDASGEPVGFRGIVRDITDRKRIEEQLFQAEKLRAVGEMASGVAHDFNNALAAILGNTQLLLYTAQDEELKETLKIIEQVAKDSGQTVRRLQDFTRRRVPQELFKVDINSIIKDSIEITKPRWKDEAQSRGIRIEIVSNLEDIPFASGNASELREVITNIIFNAIEAMHEGGKVEIRTFKKRGDIFIQISDTGVGIAEEAKKKIFEPFFTTKPFSNTGLGLSMSYGIVKRFGGEIEVESKVGQGTTFTITLPVGEEGKEEAVDPQTIKKGRKARILVIEDEEFVRSVLSRTLAQADHQVTLAEDGRRGVQLFKEGKFDIVLTDLGMPGVSGWEVCRMIKEISPHTPVGMITGWGGERSQSKMEEYGLDFIISKPFDFAQILNVVAETMESKEEG